MPKTTSAPVTAIGAIGWARAVYGAGTFVIGAASVTAHRLLLRRNETWLSDLVADPGVSSILEGALMVFAPSAGEVATALPLLRALRERHPDTPILLLATTSTGLKMAQDACLDSARLTTDCVRGYDRMLRVIRPRGMAVVQVCHAAGLPVNLIRALANREISTVVVNGYVPDRDLRKSGRAAYRLLNGVYTDIEAYCMQTAEDVSRAVRLGVPEDRMSVAGNLKFDSSSIEAPDAPSTERLLSELGIGPDETLLLAASTHEGEEETILAAFRKVLDRFPGVRLIIAPRHIARSRRILLLCQSTGFTAGLRSNVEGRPDVLVLDTMGEMKLLLGAVQAAFVGGTLVPVGGHNVLEPAARGVPVIFGPHTSHTTEAADALLDAGCAFKVHRADDLAEAFLAVLTDKSRAQSMGECAQSIVRAKSGALVKILQCVESMVMARSTGSRCGRDR